MMRDFRVGAWCVVAAEVGDGETASDGGCVRSAAKPEGKAVLVPSGYGADVFPSEGSTST